MPRFKRFIDTDVLTEAKRRLHEIWDTHDSVVVAFSGGKDSLAVLHLAREVAAERGIDVIDAVFRDEEVIPFDVVRFVEGYRNLPWLRLAWWAIPLISNKFVLGQIETYVQWDPSREWVREKPSWAVREEDLGIPVGVPTSQYTADAILASQFRGKVAIVTGVRAAEALMRLNACLARLDTPHIARSPVSKRASLCKPIYDWQDNDVFRYLYERDIPYCALYDIQTWGAIKKRVSTAIHMESAKKFDVYRRMDPDLYERVVAIWPEMTLQERYFGQLARASDEAFYAGSWDGIAAYIDDTIPTPEDRARAHAALAGARKRAAERPDSFPLYHVFQQIRANGGRRGILPADAQHRRKGARKESTV